MSGEGPVGVGVIGAGVISDTYLQNMTTFPDLRVVAVADLDLDRARDRARAHGVPQHTDVAGLLAMDDIEIVVNLTIPAVHREISAQIIAAGKSVWSEKPLALNRTDGRDLLAEAEAAGVQIACAPDTVLGAGIQTALRAIARGDIGEPLTATTMFHVPGPESWHPNPDFLYAHGAGPLLDMGPYYVTTLVNVFGAATNVSAVSSTARSSRVVGSGPRAGESFPVEVPTHHAALIRFDGGESAQSTFSFQNALPRAGFVEVSGTEGTLVLPDPNMFDGASALWTFGQPEPRTIEAVGHAGQRGTGVVDLARSIRGGTSARASGAVAEHVLDVLLSIGDAAESGRPVDITSAVAKPELLPEGWDPRERTV